LTAGDGVIRPGQFAARLVKMTQPGNALVGAGFVGGHRPRVMLVMYDVLWMANIRGSAVTVTQIDIDQDALDRVLAMSGVRTKKDAVNLALRYYAERQERAARIGRHFERARHWGAVEDAERLHRAEKNHG
jgi:Arc/MetJ family transcription regulator